jgi:hypothetical protein
LPGLRLVQFPWRALLLVEFSAITMLVLHPPKLRSIGTVAGVLLAAFAYCVLLLMIGHTVDRTLYAQARTAAEIRLHHLDAPEYLPAGTKIVQGTGPDDVSFELPTAAATSASAVAARISVSDESDGEMVVRVNSPRPTTVTLNRFYFPHWRVRDARGQIVPSWPDPRQKLVAFNAPAGRSVFYLELGTAPNEALAQIASLIAALGCGVMLCLTWGAERRPSPISG